MTDPTPQLPLNPVLPAPRAVQVARAQAELARFLARLTRQYRLTAAELVSLLSDALTEQAGRLVAMERVDGTKDP